MVLSSSLDKCEKYFPSLIITPSYPPSLINVFEPTPRTLIGKLFEKFFKKKINSSNVFGLKKTLAGPPSLNQFNRLISYS